ncbi:MAG: TlpA family protein disulfide reductase [Alistipes sp.]|jgi:peroxiredoxin|nr:TlpA family protein disulfide reductase [Alistipes sp.]
MAEKRYKRRGSALMLGIMLVVLIAITAYIIITLPSEEAQAAEGSVATLVEDEPDDLAETTLINAGDVAPDFTVEMLDGSKVTLSALQGKPTLLIFWATWCPPCRLELSKLQEHIIDRYGDKINVLPISRGEERAKVEEYISKMGYTFAVGLDGDQSIYRKYATNYIPRCFVIDAKGKVLYSGVGYDEAIAKEVEQNIEKALR